MDFVAALRRESARFHDVLAGTDLAAPVPSCPGWTVADLVWHLTQVQHFWATTAGELLAGPEQYEEPSRPRDGELLGMLRAETARLVDAVTRHPPEQECWSWYEHGHSIGWVRRRQAHEALIHRVDAELAAGADVAPADPELGADGVDEILTVMMTGVPGWATYAPSGEAVVLEATDTGRRWALELGTFTGTSPRSGKEYEDEITAQLLAGEPAAVEGVLRAGGWDLDRWLWGRADPEAVAVTGNAALRARVRELAAASTQ